MNPTTTNKKASNFFFPALRSGLGGRSQAKPRHRLLQRPSPQNQFPGNPMKLPVVLTTPAPSAGLHPKSRILAIMLTGVMLTGIMGVTSRAESVRVFKDSNAKPLGGAAAVAAGDGGLIGLTRTGEGVKFPNLPASGKLAIRYASKEVGAISIRVDDQPAKKVNVHSTGDLTRSFRYAKIDLAIPAGASVTISLGDKDVLVNIEQIRAGDGELGLPPDIWNLPALPVARGPYQPDWKALGKSYSVPAWWREAKFGAWSHWDPQSMPEQGDWYARGMYQEGHLPTLRKPMPCMR